MHAKIAGSKMVILPQAGHMTFVDQTGMFVGAVEGFVHTGSEGALHKGH
jgi:pimeloyl-ACP methyl ester carboxylesterase